MRLLIDTLQQVVVVPTAAVQRGPNGPFVYVIDDDNTVAMRPVTVSQQDDSQAVIDSGVDSGERVVTTGFAQLADGSRVAIGRRAPAAASAAAQITRRAKPRRGRHATRWQCAGAAVRPAAPRHSGRGERDRRPGQKR